MANVYTENITEEVILKYLYGRDTQERITNIECGYMDKYVTIFYRDENGDKKSMQREFFPFLWCTAKGANMLYIGDKSKIQTEIMAKGVRCKLLKTTNDENVTIDRMENGYKILFYAIKPMSYNYFLSLFKTAGVDIYNSKKQFIAVSPVEQYMIKSGKRQFKGFDDYNDLLITTYDIETEGLNPEIHRINQIGVRTNKGYEMILEVEGEDKEEKDESEKQAIYDFFAILGEIDPDVVVGHNVMLFDWDFIFKRSEILDIDVKSVSKEYMTHPVYKKKKQTVLKLGGETEYFFPYLSYSRIFLDSIHSVRRAMAIDSNMEAANLKYAAEYKKIKKTNRTYINGNLINKLYNDNENEYVYNPDNGDWFKYSDTLLEQTYKEDVVTNKQITSYSDKEIEQCNKLLSKYEIPNNITDISEFNNDKVNELKLLLSKTKCKDFSKEIDENSGLSEMDIEINKYINKVLLISKGNVFKDVTDRIYHNKFELDSEGNIIDLEYNIKLKKTFGRFIVCRYLLDDLYEGEKVEIMYNQPNFQLAKMIPIPFQRSATSGVAGIWKSILMGFSFENDLAIPMFGEKKTFTGGLSRLYKCGFMKDIVKFDFNSLYPSICITYNTFPDLDISNAFKLLLTVVLSKREEYKQLMGQCKKNNDSEGAVRYDNLQLPFKITANAFFGSISSPSIFPWGDVEYSGERITCIARQSLRLMIKWFGDRGFVSLLSDTDGNAFSYTDVDLTYSYVSKGLNRNTENGKTYYGLEAYCAEFNDLFMRGKMGLGLDEISTEFVALRRKNYFERMEDGKVKKIGNSVKSKSMPTYIKKFIDKNTSVILDGNGYQFIKNYNEYIEKIYNGNIPLRDIASKGKIKRSIKEYLDDLKVPTKSGGSRGSQAFMELAIQDKLNINVSDTIYYINTGTKKTDTDTKKVEIYKTDENGNFITEDFINKNGEKVLLKKGGYKQKKIVDRVEKVLQCIRIDNSIIEMDEDVYGNEPELFETPIRYNADKYINQFNNRIRGFMVCFNPDIRDSILVTNPSEIQSFTEEQCKLVAGHPLKIEHQDSIENLFTLEDQEVEFWLRINETPIFNDETGIDWETQKANYLKRLEMLKQDEIAIEKGMYDKVYDNVEKK
ncbi:MAG: hypothetical protein M0R03_17950, partial [Novosphingobium sp.]|nr:hypothetical protein [Novosphingobium sp.]